MNKYIKDFKDIFLYALSSIEVIGLFLILLIANTDVWLAFTICLILAGFLFYRKDKSGSGLNRKKRLKRLSPEKEDFYQSQGLSSEEIRFFRETMQTAKSQILSVERNFEGTAKLKAIEHRHNTLRIAKSLFKEITQNPKKLHEVDRFLYVHLPSLKDLTDKYAEIDRHEAKTRSTYEILEKSSETINELCALIVQDYVDFKSEDLNEMEIEMELAKRTIERDNGQNQSIEKDEI